MSTMSQLRAAVRDRVYSAMVVERDSFIRVNDADINTAEETFTVEDGTQVSRGDILEFQDNGEQVYVMDVATNLVTAVRGFNNTTDADHADNVLLRRNPRFTLKQLEDAINASVYELESLGVWVWGYGSLTVDTDTHMYDLVETDIIPTIGVVSVYHEESSWGTPYPLVFNYHYAHTTPTASKSALGVPSWGQQGDGDSLVYVYAKRIDDVTELLARQDEIVVLGAVSKLVPATSIGRTQDPGRFTDRGVQPGQGIRDGGFYLAMFQRAAKAESAMLKAEQFSFPNTIYSSRARRYRR